MDENTDKCECDGTHKMCLFCIQFLVSACEKKENCRLCGCEKYIPVGVTGTCIDCYITKDVKIDTKKLCLFCENTVSGGYLVCTDCCEGHKN